MTDIMHAAATPVVISDAETAATFGEPCGHGLLLCQDGNGRRYRVTIDIHFARMLDIALADETIDPFEAAEFGLRQATNEREGWPF